MVPGVHHTLTVSVGTGASGTARRGYLHPDYLEGDSVPYSYTASGCYGNLAVTLDGTPIASSGTVVMNTDHALAVTASLKTFTITATAGTGGTISPSGATVLNCGASQGYTIGALGGYHIQDVQIDGVSAGALGTYTFTNVVADHTIAASFSLNRTQTLTVSLGHLGHPLGHRHLSPGDGRELRLRRGRLLLPGPRRAGRRRHRARLGHRHHEREPRARHLRLAQERHHRGHRRARRLHLAVGDHPGHCGGSQSYTITPVTFYQIADVKVDGTSVGTPSTYTFSDVRSSHTIAATFSPVPNHTLSVSLGAGITGSPNATTIYPEGASVNYAYTLADPCYQNLLVRLDGAPASASGTITMDRDHALVVTVDGIPPRRQPGRRHLGHARLVDASTPATRTSTTPTACSPGTRTSPSRSTTPGPRQRHDPHGPGPPHRHVGHAHHLHHPTSVIGGSGTITPSGVVTVPYNGNQNFTFTSAPGYQVWDVLVDGTSVGHPSSYPFTNVLADHTLQVLFMIPLSVTCNATPPSGVAPLTVAFTANPYGGLPAGYTYSWDFGDGGTSTLQNPTHEYAAIGDYTATLTLNDGVQVAHCQTDVSATVNHDPVVFGLLATPSTIELGVTSTVSFTLTDPDMNDTISWTATLTQSATGLGLLDTLSGGPVGSGSTESSEVHPLKACPSGSCTATVQITATDSHGGTSSQSVVISIQ